METKKTYTISGMSCAACAARIEKGLKKLDGVKDANVNLAMEKASVVYDPSLLNDEKINETIPEAEGR